jgi:hypothetical protein
MKLRFSRYAKRRAKLYKIPESIISTILTGMELPQGEHEIIQNMVEFRYPLKIVVSVARETATVITAYPVKKGRNK